MWVGSERSTLCASANEELGTLADNTHSDCLVTEMLQKLTIEFVSEITNSRGKIQRRMLSSSTVDIFTVCYCEENLMTSWRRAFGCSPHKKTVAVFFETKTGQPFKLKELFFYERENTDNQCSGERVAAAQRCGGASIANTRADDTWWRGIGNCKKIDWMLGFLGCPWCRKMLTCMSTHGNEMATFVGKVKDVKGFHLRGNSIEQGDVLRKAKGWEITFG